MADPDPGGILVAPIASMIEQIGASVAEASVQLNTQQLEALEQYPPQLREMGLMPTIFHMQEVEVELKLALHMTPGSGEPVKDDRGILRRGWDFIIGATPVNADYQNGPEFDVSGASSLRMRFAPGPPPEIDEVPAESDVPPQIDEGQ